MDIAVIWPPHDPDEGMEFTLFERPITRFAYWLSHGVPTIYFPYESYEEIVRLGVPYPLRAENVEQVLQLVRMLIASPDLRVALSKIGLAASRVFTPAHNALVYERMLCNHANPAALPPRPQTPPAAPAPHIAAVAAADVTADTP